MGKQFGTVEIFAFDLHTALVPLVQKTVADPFKFLADPALYRAAYKAANKIETKNFTIAPLSADAIRRHHLWSRYASPELASEPDYWALQMPLLCQAKNLDLKLSPNVNVKATVEASTWLFPMGWSTHIEFVLQDPIGEENLVALSGALHHGQPILVSGQESSVKDIFILLSKRLTKDIYKDFQKANSDLQLDRRLVISLGNYSGPVEAYKPGSATGMPLKVRALMHGILLGRDVSDEELLSFEKTQGGTKGGKNKFLLTELRAKSESLDFAITHFDEGSLLLVQKGFSSKSKRESFHCFGSNVRYFTMMALAWACFDKELRRRLPDPKLRPSHMQEIKPEQQLMALQRYKSRFSESFFRTHGALSFVRS